MSGRTAGIMSATNIPNRKKQKDVQTTLKSHKYLV